MIRHNCTGPDGKSDPRVVNWEDDATSLMQFCCFCGKRIPYTAIPVPDPVKVKPPKAPDFEKVKEDKPRTPMADAAAIATADAISTE